MLFQKYKRRDEKKNNYLRQEVNTDRGKDGYVLRGKTVMFYIFMLILKRKTVECFVMFHGGCSSWDSCSLFISFPVVFQWKQLFVCLAPKNKH